VISHSKADRNQQEAVSRRLRISSTCQNPLELVSSNCLMRRSRLLKTKTTAKCSTLSSSKCSSVSSLKTAKRTNLRRKSSLCAKSRNKYRSQNKFLTNPLNLRNKNNRNSMSPRLTKALHTIPPLTQAPGFKTQNNLMNMARLAVLLSAMTAAESSMSKLL
jgi:hypothetical protein